jgi:transcriptional regulator with XRE-family HTH domain
MTAAIYANISSAMHVLPFSSRLQELLTRQGPVGTQAALADRSGIDRSLISRMVKGERLPTSETLQALAPALGVGVAELVAGTDAESRLAEVSDHVRRSDYEEAVGKVIEYEGRIRELEGRARAQDEQLHREHAARRTAEDLFEAQRAAREKAEATLAELQGRHESQEQELARYKDALTRALAEFSTLKSRVEALQAEVGRSKDSSKVSALLAGVAAITGVATLAHFLGDTPSSKPSRKKGTNE